MTTCSRFSQLILLIMAAWTNYVWPTCRFAKTWQFAGHFQ